MNPINNSNYEQYIVDYWDGTLSEQEQQALELFLAQNPHIQNILPDEIVCCEPDESLVFAHKNRLMADSMQANEAVVLLRPLNRWYNNIQQLRRVAAIVALVLLITAVTTWQNDTVKEMAQNQISPAKTPNPAPQTLPEQDHNMYSNPNTATQAMPTIAPNISLPPLNHIATNNPKTTTISKAINKPIHTPLPATAINSTKTSFSTIANTLLENKPNSVPAISHSEELRVNAKSNLPSRLEAPNLEYLPTIAADIVNYPPTYINDPMYVVMAQNSDNTYANKRFPLNQAMQILGAKLINQLDQKAKENNTFSSLRESLVPEVYHATLSEP